MVGLTVGLVLVGLSVLFVIRPSDSAKAAETYQQAQENLGILLTVKSAISKASSLAEGIQYRIKYGTSAIGNEESKQLVDELERALGEARKLQSSTGGE